MADISISPLAPREFRVQVREGDGETTHQVTVPNRLGEELELRDDDLERVVRESFAFSSSASRPPRSWRSSRSATSPATSPNTQANSRAACPEPARSPSEGAENPLKLRPRDLLTAGHGCANQLLFA